MHEPFIRQAIELAITAGKNGNHTFGAALVHEGQVIATAENTAITGTGYGHAEYNLAIKAASEFPESVLTNCTLYSSCTPCARCTFSMLAVGIPRIVYSVGRAAFDSLLPEPYVTLDVEDIIRRLELDHVEVIGPVLEDEGLLAFQYWGGEFKPLAEILAFAKQAREKRE